MQNQVALITGGGRGIGRAVSLALANNGADLAIGYRSQETSATNVARDVLLRGRVALTVQVDVADRSSVKRMVQAVIKQLGRIDILVNNAGILQQKDVQTISDQDWDHVMDTNLKGVFLCCQEVLPIMQAQRSGCIINISSSGGQLGGTLAVHYAASKAGVISLTKSFARLGAVHGIRVNCVAPGLIQTEMTESEIQSEAGQIKIQQQILLGRPGQASEVAAMVAFLASNEASYITGQTLNVNGGLYMG